MAEIPIPALRDFLEPVTELDYQTLTLNTVSHMIRRRSEEAVTHAYSIAPSTLRNVYGKPRYCDGWGKLFPTVIADRMCLSLSIMFSSSCTASPT